jgi:hypothetical protein
MNGMKDQCECTLCTKAKPTGQKLKTITSFKPRPRAPREIAKRDTAADLGESHEFQELP